MAKVALLIGVSEYESGLNPLPAAVKDVEAMRGVLVNPEMGGFADGDITVLKNPQPQDIRDAIFYLFADRRKDDLLLFYFSGHGIKDDRGKLYLSTRATTKNNGKLVKPSAVAASYLHENINDSRSQRQVIILDCCFSGAIAQGMSVKDDGSVNVQQQLGGKGRAILTSSTSTQYSFEQEGSELSIYTRYLVEGIDTGVADKDGDGWISIDELHEYARSKVQEASPAMTPKFYPVEEGHKILLAKSPKDDPRVIYRQEVERRAQGTQGNFSVFALRILELKRDELKISQEEATAIQEEVLQPYREYERKRHEYEQALIEAVNQQYPFSQATQKDIKDYQQYLGLRDEDIAAIEQRVLGTKQVEYKRQQHETERLEQYKTTQISRKQFLKWAGLSSAGLVCSILLINGISNLYIDNTVENKPQQPAHSSATDTAATSTGKLDLGGKLTINGAGASFPAPLYQRWFADLNKKYPNLQVNYQSVGSGAGIKQFKAGTVDFGASDVAMKDQDIAEVDPNKGVLLLPMSAGSVVLAYNLPGVEGLKLSRKVYVDILLGKIKKWNDPKLAAANPGVNLPDKDIRFVHRSDGSGTTGVFTKHLSAISPEWKSKVGDGKTVQWPTGVGAKGNEGITAQIKQTEGSIGYIEYGYAKLNKIAFATLENKEGEFVKPSYESASKTLSAVTLPDNLRAFITDPEGKESYPIVTYTWILAYKKYDNPNKAKAVEAMIEYGLTEGQKVSTELGYIPLPEKVVQKVAAAADVIAPDYKISVTSAK